MNTANIKFVISILLYGGFSYLGGMFLPWWGFVPIIFLLAAVINQKNLRSFLAGFLAIFILWVILAWIIDSANQHILSQRTAMILPLNGNSLLLILLTGLIGGILGGMASLTGSLLRSHKKAPESYYQKR